jgi:general secretion pathway protein G
MRRVPDRPAPLPARSEAGALEAAPRTPPSPAKPRGFTLIELLVVMAIIGVLASIGIPMLLSTPIKAKEAALKENLFTFRSCLDQYKADKGRYPESLEVLVQEKYIRKVPIDPFTKSADTWQLVFEEPDSAEAASEEPPGVIDVHSGSDLTALDGTLYSTW